MDEATALKRITSRSSTVALPTYQISWKSTCRFKIF